MRSTRRPLNDGRFFCLPRRTLLKGSLLLPLAVMFQQGRAASFKTVYPDFLALSRKLTRRALPDNAETRQLYQGFLDEPWFAEHVHSTLAVLQKHGTPPPGTAQAWFARHVLTTWYLGVYYHERTPPKRWLKASALRHQAISGLVPLRFREYTGYAAWSQRPPGAT